MVGAVIITHGTLGQSLIDAASGISGEIKNIKAVSVRSADATEGLRDALKAAVSGVNAGNGVIIFTDMFGGTPTNIALSFLAEKGVEVITGVNLPVILKFLSHREEKVLKDLAAQLRKYGQESIVLATEMLKEKKRGG